MQHLRAPDCFALVTNPFKIHDDADFFSFLGNPSSQSLSGMRTLLCGHSHLEGHRVHRSKVPGRSQGRLDELPIPHPGALLRAGAIPKGHCRGVVLRDEPLAGTVAGVGVGEAGHDVGITGLWGAGIAVDVLQPRTACCHVAQCAGGRDMHELHPKLRYSVDLKEMQQFNEKLAKGKNK